MTIEQKAQPLTHDEHVAMLEREARAHVNRINSAIVNRREHPSYGYTKADMYESFDRLVGILWSLGLVKHDRVSANIKLQAREVARELGIELGQLECRIEDSKKGRR